MLILIDAKKKLAKFKILAILEYEETGTSCIIDLTIDLRWGERRRGGRGKGGKGGEKREERPTLQRDGGKKGKEKKRTLENMNLCFTEYEWLI